MPLFQVQNGKARLIKENVFPLERELQKLTEENLETVFGLQFISSEFQLQGLRIDTLAFDPELNTFVVVEYKRDKNFSVIDQGFSYLALMINNKADFILEYNEKTKKNLKRQDVDWSQARVLFLAHSFTNYQQSAINFRDLPIELWEVIRFDNSSILYNQIKAADAVASIKTLKQSREVENISKEIKSYTEDGFLASRPNGEGKKIYGLLKEKISIIDPNLVVHPTKTYIAYRMPNNWRNIFAFHVFKDKIRTDVLRAEPDDFKDPEKRVFYMKDSMKYFNQHISSMEISSEKEVEYGIYILQQAYDRFVKGNA